MDEYQWVRMRGDELIRDAELARQAAEARRAAGTAERPAAGSVRPVRAARWLVLAAGSMWHRLAGGAPASVPSRRVVLDRHAGTAR